MVTRPATRKEWLSPPGHGEVRNRDLAERKGDAPMDSLADYKNRVSAKGAVTDWLTSDSANWRSLSVLLREREYRADALAVPAFPNPSIILAVNSSFRMEYFSEGRWRKIDYTRGTGTLT